MLLLIAMACGDANEGDGTSDPFDDPNAYFDDSSPVDDGGAPVKECVTDLQCTGGQICVSGKCFTPSNKKKADPTKKACVINFDCGSGEKCSDGICKTNSSSDSGSSGGGSGKSKKKTKDDGDDGDDGGDGAGPAGFDPPPPCTTSSDCMQGKYCDDGTCIDPASVSCKSDINCTDDFVCKDGACFAGCVYDGHCNEGEVCQGNQCVDVAAECYIDAQCGNYGKCKSNKCVSIQANLDCESYSDCGWGQICDTGIKQCIAYESCEFAACTDPGMICDESIGICVTNLAPDVSTFKDGNSYFMVFGQDASGKLATVYRDAKAKVWNDPTQLKSTANPSSNSIAVFNGANGNIEVFARDDKDNDSTNSKILHWYFSAKTRTWSKGAVLKGTYNARGNPTAVYNPAKKAIEVFAKDHVGGLLYWYWTASSGWSSDVQTVSVMGRIYGDSSPTAFYYPQHRNTHVFGRSPDNRLYHWRGNENASPQSIGQKNYADEIIFAAGQVANQPSVTFQGAHGGIWISAVTKDNKISLLVYDLQSQWYTVATLGVVGINFVGRTAIVYNPKTTDVEIFATDTDHEVNRWYWDSAKGIEDGHQTMIGHATQKDVVAAFDHHLRAIRVFVHGDGSTFKQLVADPNKTNSFKADQSINFAAEPSVMVYPPLEASRYHGGDGGGKFSILCPKDSVAIGLRAYHGSDVDQIGLVCKDLTTNEVYRTALSNGDDAGDERTCPDGVNGEQGILIDALSNGDWFEYESSYDCPWFGDCSIGYTSTWVIKGLAGACGFLSNSNDPDGVTILWGPLALGVYGEMSPKYWSEVPDGAVITGIQGASGSRLDRFNFLYKIIDVTKP